MSDQLLASLLPLEPVDEKVYEWFASVPDADVEELLTGLAMSKQEALDSIERLCRLTLLIPRSRYAGRYAAVSPARAKQQLSRAVAEDMAVRQLAADRLRTEIENLSDRFQAGESGRLGVTPVETIALGCARESILASLVSEARNEVCVWLDDGGILDVASIEDWVGNGAAIRVLCRYTAQFDPALEPRLAALAARVRTLIGGGHWLVVVDRTVAVLPAVNDPDGAIVARDPGMTAFAGRVFDEAWSRARVLPARYEQQLVREISDDVKAAVVRLLVEGMADKLIARRLGMSLRTCQRHVSEIIAALGARNRLQAGYMIARIGLMGHPPAWPPGDPNA